MGHSDREAEPQELAIPAGIPAQEHRVYREYFRQQRTHLSELLSHLGSSFDDTMIPVKREKKLRKAQAHHAIMRKNLVFKAFLAAALAGGSGYCAHKGCTIPETTAVAGVISVGSGLLALNYAYDWYCLPRPSYESIAKELEQKNRHYPDWRLVIARKIEKICLPNVSKGK